VADQIQQLLKIVEAVLLRTLLLEVILRCTFDYRLKLNSGCFPWTAGTSAATRKFTLSSYHTGL
jgi:hypothetical protein